MKSKLPSRQIVDYLMATQNEILIDQYAMRLVKNSPDVIGYIPRPAKWLRYGLKFPTFTRLMSSFARHIWFFGGAAAYFLAQAIPRMWSAPATAIILKGGQVLALSTRVGDIVDPEHFDNTQSSWITLPWAPLKRYVQNVHYVDAFTLVTRRELWQAWRDALTATYVMASRDRSSKWVLQSYTAWQWFVVRAAVDKLPGPLLMTENYDRWAVLVDSSVWSKKFGHKNEFPLQRKELILMQHGSVQGLSGSAVSEAPELKLRRRLRAVTRLHVYGPDEERAFKENIISEACVRRGIEITYFTPSIELKNLVSEKLPRVLFVGHPICENLHLKILESLQIEYEFAALYKPHPTASMSKRMNSPSWSIIKESDQFPVVDLVISYPSTLVAEYSAHNIPAAVHPIDLDGENSGPILDEIRNRLDLFIKKKCTQNRLK